MDKLFSITVLWTSSLSSKVHLSRFIRHIMPNAFPNKNRLKIASFFNLYDLSFFGKTRIFVAFCVFVGLVCFTNKRTEFLFSRSIHSINCSIQFIHLLNK